ncbi:MAG: hypothetical protein JXB07_19965 [Anaerolineae bacterium]|nr:hypothetical protein [Anaerolineae bacterium]
MSDERVRAWDLIRLADAVMGIGVKADIQLFGGSSQGHKGIPGANTIRGAGAKADISFSNTPSSSRFGGIVTQRQFGILQGEEQSFLFSLGLGNTFIEIIVTGTSRE